MQATTATRTGERRRSRRYRPPTGFRPDVRRTGWLGLLEANRCKVCLDVSEGGFRAILDGQVREGQILRVSLGGHRLAARVRFAAPSRPNPGCREAGLQFLEPAPAFLAWLRDSLLRWSQPVMSGRRREAASQERMESKRSISMDFA